MSITTMIKIETPTATERTKTEIIELECGIKLQREPIKSPTRCPPITFLGLAVMSFGIAKMINDVAPMEATTTAF